MSFRYIEKTKKDSRDEYGEPVRIAVLGTGWIAEHVYLPCLMNHPEVQIVAAHDPSLEVLHRFAQNAGIPLHAIGLEACFAPEVDGLLLCTPPLVHAQQIVQAVSLGKYVLCEKPVFRNTAELKTFESMGSVASRLMGSASMRHRKDVALLLRWVQEGILGALERVRLCWWRERGVPSPGSWRTDPERCPLGVMEDLGPHLLDLLAALVSAHVWKELRVVDASLDCRYGDKGISGANWFQADAAVHYAVPDQGSVTLLSDTGTQVEVEVCWAGDLPGDYCSFSFEGENGSAGFKGLLGLSNLRRSPQQYCSLELDGQPLQIQQFPIGPGLQMEAFADSIDVFAGFCRNQCRPAAHFAEIRRVAQWLTRIQEICQFRLRSPYQQTHQTCLEGEVR